MKKIYAFFAAALMSVSLFAIPEKIPTTADLSQVADLDGNVVFCCYFSGDAEVCNDIYYVGTFSSWGFNEEYKMEKLEGFDGWYFVQAHYDAGFMGKPIQADANGELNWKYQPGDPEAWIHHGGEEITLSLENGSESKTEYGKAGAYIYEITYWKEHNTPCVTIPKHKYTVVLFDPFCEENPEFVPAIAGEFNNWGDPVSLEESTYEGDAAWVTIIETEEGNKFKFLEATIGWDNAFEYYDSENDAWKQFGDRPFPVASADTTLVFDYSDTELYRYPKCGAEPEDTTKYYTCVAVKVPAGAPEAGVEIIGTFDEWAGTAMELLNTGYWFAELEVAGGEQFKFREAGDTEWANQIVYVATGEPVIGSENLTFKDHWKDDSWKGVDCKWVELDYSNAETYVWKANWVKPEGIENVVLTEKAQKVVVDGVLYIVRDNKMYNAQGTQVR